MNAPETFPTQMVELEKYAEHPRNYNRHPEKQVAQLKLSLQELGQPAPISVWRGWIMTGNGLTMAARELGYTHLEAKVLPESWGEEKALAWLVADNEHAKGSDPDQVALGNILQLLQRTGQDAETSAASLGMSGKGARNAVREALRDAGVDSVGEDDGTQAGRAAELMGKWGTERGQIWTLGDHRLLVGDCMDRAQVARLFNGRQAHQLLTDPPYGVDYSSKNEWLNEYDKGARIQTPILGDTEIEIGDYVSFFTDFLTVAGAHLTPYNTVYIFMAGQELHSLRAALSLAGMTWGDYLIWDKKTHVLSRKDYQPAHEFVAYGWKGKHQFFGGYTTTVQRMWDKPASEMGEDEMRALLVAIEAASDIIPWPKNSKNVWHPTEKPVGLLERFIRDGTELPGAVVYDPFIGSGSTLIACERLGRRCYGIDRSPGWIASAIERWVMMTGKEPTCQKDATDE